MVVGRKRLSKALNLWMNGERVARWSVSSSGTHELSYYESWLASPGRRPVSLSLPLIPPTQSHSGHIVESFFDNLLPDSQPIRNRIQARYSKRNGRPFDLLEEIGRDCVGAIQLLPLDAASVNIKRIDSRKVTAKEIEKILQTTSGQNSEYQIHKEEFRISVAGAQEKTSFLKHKGNWHVPLGATPSTHIFKLPIGPLHNVDMSTSVENELLCLKILHAFDIPVPKAQIQHFGSQKVLAVERFDRKKAHDGKWIIRLPQEDMCQAMGVSPALKYESDGGPGIAEIMELLIGSQKYETDRRIFYKTQILFWLLAAPDGHAKNFSVMIAPGGHYSLAPVYDVLSAYPLLGPGSKHIAPQKLKLAMAVWGKRKHYHWNKVRRDHWITTGVKNGLTEKVCESVIDEILSQCKPAINTVQSNLTPETDGTIAESIFKGMSETVQKLKA